MLANKHTKYHISQIGGLTNDELGGKWSRAGTVSAIGSHLGKSFDKCTKQWEKNNKNEIN